MMLTYCFALSTAITVKLLQMRMSILWISAATGFGFNAAEAAAAAAARAKTGKQLSSERSLSLRDGVSGLPSPGKTPHD